MDRTRQRRQGTSGHRPTSAAAFTLVELLVVIAIVVLLISILTPSLQQARRITRLGVCGSNERQLGLGFQAYAQNHGTRLPYAGRFWNNQQMRYVHYWTENYPSGASTAGWQSWGLLSKNGYVDHHSWVWFCPVNDVTGVRRPGGDRSHPNNVPGPKNLVLLPEDSGLDWTFARAGYHRRVLGETGAFDCISMAEVGRRAFFADICSTNQQIRQSHGDSVNVWYGDGHTRLMTVDLVDGPLAGVTTYDIGRWRGRFEAFWNKLDKR